MRPIMKVSEMKKEFYFMLFFLLLMNSSTNRNSQERIHDRAIRIDKAYRNYPDRFRYFMMWPSSFLAI